ncbi:hypothetical protein Q5752_004118 [Cryptotrichosporon argae]
MPHSKPQQASLNHTLVGPAPDDAHDRAHALLELAVALVEAALDVVTRHIDSDAQMVKESVLMPGGTLGKHFRHVIETFTAFLAPLSTASPHAPLAINYDAILPASRRPVARSRAACRAALVGVIDGLRAWGAQCDTAARAAGGPESGVGRGAAGETRGVGLADVFEQQVGLVAITPTKQELRSSIGRELWFCSLHAIHHFSMLRTIAVHEMGIDLPVEFGTAPSTLLYRGTDWQPPPEVREAQNGARAKL